MVLVRAGMAVVRRVQLVRKRLNTSMYTKVSFKGKAVPMPCAMVLGRLQDVSA